MAAIQTQAHLVQQPICYAFQKVRVVQQLVQGSLQAGVIVRILT
jgi:hypothetical protein